MTLSLLDRRLCRLSMALCLLAAASGCGSDDSGGGSGGSSGSGGSGGSGGGSATVSYSGVMSELALAGTTPIEGVKVCIDGHSEITCSTSAADGKYTLTGLPVGAELMLKATKDAYVDSATFVTTEQTDVTTYDGVVVSAATAGLLYAAAGAGTYDVTKGSIGGTVVEPDPAVPGKNKGIAGATVKLTPSSGTGPVYTSATNVPDKTLTAATSSGGAVWGGVTPGEFSVEATVAGKTCATSGYGWASANGAKGVALADTASFVIILCK